MEISQHTLIKKELWDAAKWVDTAFLYPQDGEGQPAIGLLFQDFEAAKKLFADLQAQLGGVDRQEHLRVVIVTGTRPDGRVGYTVRFGINPKNLVADGPGSYVIVGSRSRFKETRGQNQSLEQFRKGFERHRMYFIAPLDASNPQVDLDLIIGKTEISFRDFADIAPDDIDGDVLGA